MTSLLVEPEIVSAAVADIETIGSTVTAASGAAAAPTSNLLAAAADEVSVAFANLFGAYGKEFQAVVGQVEAFQTQFQRTLAAAANALGTAAAPNASCSAVTVASSV
ncbi:PE family protein, partial [Mycobacterium intermedium]|uniref:PE family protein n=1 Tax=Mycobacterium intermedium TaxID=28445 RepID=UPI00111C4C2E